MYCANCGQEMPDDVRFCTNCGTATKPPEAPAAPDEARQGRPESGFRIAIVAIVIAAIVAIAGIVAFATLGFPGASAPSAGILEQGSPSSKGNAGNAGSAGGSDGAGNASSAQESGKHAPVEYSYETATLARYDETRGNYAGKPQFSYIQISSSEPNEKIDELNRTMKDAAEQARDKELTEEIYENGITSSDDSLYYTDFTYEVTYFDEGIACILKSYGLMSPGAAHGMPYNECTIVNLETGEELSAAEFAGVPEKDLRVMAWAAADAYLRAGNGLYESAANAFSGSPASEGVPDGSAVYYLSPNGVMALFGAYVIDSFAGGTPSLLVCDFNGKSVTTSTQYPLVTQETGTMTVEEPWDGTQSGGTSKKDNDDGQASTNAKQVALDFATQYFTNTTLPDPSTDMVVESIDNWEELVSAYFEPGSAADVEFTNERNSSPIRGLGVACIVTDAAVMASSGNEVVVDVTYVGTQNPIEGWSKGDGHVATFTCKVSGEGLITSYDISQ